MGTPNPTRDAAIVALLLAGRHNAEAAWRFGLHRTRISQIRKAAKLPDGRAWRKKEKANA